ncbi:MAG TPA: YdeI/OmpD-associated family protein [Usitatibacter sp.]|nr:YdeI/OmpD-associated family protein [Usitatibacter sp.]
MGSRDKRVDAYIANAAEFARPILEELRRRVHAAVPEVDETIKWSMPHFDYKGKMLGGMAAFKAHCSFGFWHPLMRVEGASDEAMGQFGRIRSLEDLPAEARFEKLAKRAKKLVDDGVKAPPKPRAGKKEAAAPKELVAALRRNAAASKAWEEFSPSHRREYIEWIEEAKTEPTRVRRLATTLEQLAEGKPRHWKYAKC